MPTSSPSTRLPTWDVILADGSTARVRPVSPDDIPEVTALHGRLSKETVRLRYFGAHPHLSESELARLVEKEGPEHLALVAELAGQLVGVAQYDRIPGSDVAEVAFVVDDAHQGLGIGTLLLEYLASEGRRYGLRRFAADTLFENARMVNVFRAAGFTQHSQLEGGVIRVVMDISPTTEALHALYERDRKAAARSMQRLLRPRSVAVIGASRSPGTVGHELVRNLVSGGFQGPVYPVNPTASHIASVPSFPGIDHIPGEVDLAIVAVPAHAVPEVVDHAAAKASVAWLSSRRILPRTGRMGRHWSARRPRLAHSYGMRVVGPNCFGVLNTDPAVSMNATFAKDTPMAGRLGFASQSGGLGIAILAEAKKRGIGLSSFVSMGNKADVSGNDLLSWWAEDEATASACYTSSRLVTLGKFARLARQFSRSKPVIAVKSAAPRLDAGPPPRIQRRWPAPTSSAALFRQTGVIRVDTIEELFRCGPGGRVPAVG